MTSQASTYLIISEPPDDINTNEPWSIETYAEGLMDELFTDIDNILDTGEKFSVHPPKTVTVTIPDVFSEPTSQQPNQGTVSLKHKPSSTLVVSNPTVTAISTKNPQKSSGLGKLLILGLTLSLGMVAILYFNESGQFTTLNLPTTQPQPPIPIKPDAHADLVNYMLEALTVIDQQEVTNNQISGKAGFPNVNLNQTTALALPNTQAMGYLPPSPYGLPVPTRPNVVERIYIPVYQNAPTVGDGQPQVPVIPTPPNVGQIPEKPATAAIPTIPNPQQLGIVPPKLPTATAPVSKTNPEQAYSPAVLAELEGLLELGQKSAALFKINGVTRRINIGENIGSTGWTLVEVVNGEALIRRNGEVRSIYAGQKL
ncbi:hypothetical protein VB711_21715 [Cronbergia sp. UHCC 0137]|uniref:hypothetical protein n=1 Tax=Cronbergia sp. UHCC 0137 TaxID=3110239 RepID=UPI002B2083FB|nr:hypothetical protein [Cronbergia sp. UHCC 0137]MEA5620439.1 hypothetical protein [Cronbergia sp. UHCC 0137]